MQRRFVGVLSCALALQSGVVFAADAGTQFNLECRFRSERTTGDPVLFTYSAAERSGVSYRVDLRAGKYCEGLCRNSVPITEANATHAVLSSASEQSSVPGVTRVTHATALELASKRLVFAHVGANGDKVVWGVQELFECTTGAFTGLP